MIPTILDDQYKATPSAFDHKVTSCLDEGGKQVEARLKREGPHRIVVCVHDTHAPEVEQAMELVSRHAEPGDTVVLLTILPQKLFDPLGFTSKAKQSKAAPSRETEQQALEELRKSKLDDLTQLHKKLPENVQIARHVSHDAYIRDAIEHAINYHKADLVVLRASHKKPKALSATPLSTWLIAHAPCPVLVIR